MGVTIAQDGIGNGPFAPSAKVLVAGVEAAWLSVDVTLAVYGVASVISADVPMIVDGVQRDLGTEAQNNPELPLAVNVGMTDTSGVQAPLALTQLETGFLEECRDHCAANMTALTGRSTAALFQDTYIADAAEFSQRGDQIVKLFFDTKGIPLTKVESPFFRGRPGYTEGQFLKAYRARSMWDEMRDAALADGYVLTLHNGQGYYGPPPASMPTIALTWGRDLIDCEVSHSARRAHDIIVRIDGYDRKAKTPISASYSKSGFGGDSPPDDISSAVRVYPFWGGNTTRTALRAKARARWLDLVQRELTATLDFVPDPPFLKMLCQVGGQFAVQLSGRKPSQNGVYYPREVHLSMKAGESDNPTCTVQIVASNIPPATDEGEQ